uniref:Ovule protein n=1 Tax=Angiostrongylus cantonensis TaxID=6313 RepID=A0A0K0D6N7_ANGCA
MKQTDKADGVQISPVLYDNHSPCDSPTKHYKSIYYYDVISSHLIVIVMALSASCVESKASGICELNTSICIINMPAAFFRDFYKIVAMQTKAGYV